MGYDTVVLGGGLAGIAAAVRLADAGLPVCLIEKKSFLGGRTYSIKDRKSGDTVDNGQHIVMGCYHETFDLLRTLGTYEGIHFQDNLEVTYRNPQGIVDKLQCPALPGPFHLLGGLLRMKSFSWKDKLAALRFGLALRIPKLIHNNETVEKFCQRMGQPERMRQMMWDSIAISALNEECSLADMKLFREVLTQAFFSAAKESRIGLPSIPLQELIGDAAARYLAERGCSVRFNEKAVQLIHDGISVQEIILSSGERIQGENFISAMPAKALQGMIHASCLTEKIIIPELGSSPILSVYLWYEKPFEAEPICCLLDCTYEWAFYRNPFVREGEHKRHCFCLVASAARRFQEKGREALIQAAIEDINRLYPASREQQPSSATVFWEPRATFSPTPENVKKRLKPQTCLTNFYLAGDWTNTGLPATIEGAVKSGNTAAGLLL